ncbi:bacteriocin-protection protein [Roseateles aquatilis]|uniref:Bacteriocin-protection protein n=1 Tax=Roseateles aquatilis TaxID=431061 RepID=A0A246JMQ2_9BURK|nr:YdeI/OmpD-associated family protein [Roseateles aquatilis]OWQ93459.1 bacteriocin-protection protein [Roseateles aquatilis]
MAARTPIFFATPADFRDWLDQHAATASELVVGFHKRATGAPSIDWPESVDEALCHGWIDCVRTRIDDKTYKIRFTPRRAGSIWSAVNIGRVEALLAQGRMKPAGLAAFEARLEHKSRVYSFEQPKELVELTPSHEVIFMRHADAWAFFQKQPDGYRRTSIWHILSAKKPETQLARLDRLIEASARGERL